jgi:uncharacterized protein
MQKRNFSDRQSFPGTHNNGFDVLLNIMADIQRLPTLVLFAIFLLVAGLVSLFQWERTFTLWLFMLVDWGLLRLLPRFGISYGPANPTALALALPRALVGLLPPMFSIPLQIIGTLLVLYGFYYEPQHLTVTYQTLKSSKLKAGKPLKVLHLGDLHMERITRRDERLIELTRSLQPDLILFSGDFLNLSYLHDAKAQADCRKVWQQISAPLGVYVVTGSPAVDLDEIIPPLLEGLPLHWLRDEKVTIEKDGQVIDLVGMPCTHKPFVDGPKLATILHKEPDSQPLPGFTLLLYHTPDLAPDAADLGVDLQLSGHTHGGQVRLPFYGAIFTASLYGKLLEVGRRQVGALTLYVTRGIGMEGAGAPRVRFLCPPEIILWELDGN